MHSKQRYLRSLSEFKKTLIIAAEILIGLFFSILSLITFDDLSEYAMKQNLGFLDSSVINAIAAIRTPFLNKVMFFFTDLGGPFFLTLATLIIALFLLKKHKKETALFLITMIMGVVLNASLKVMFDRQRPQISPLAIELSKSFPSAHAMNNFIFYFLLVYLTYHLSKNKRLTITVGLIATLMVGLISFSRIYLGVHYLSDVLAGLVAGFWCIVTLLSVAYTMVLFNLFMPKLTLKEKIIAFFKRIFEAMRKR